MKQLYTAAVTVRGGRDGHARSTDGQLTVPLGFPRELGGNGTGVNPEQLFAAGFAACFASSIKVAARTLSVAIGEVTVDAAATLSLRDDGSYLVSAVALHVRADGLNDTTVAVLREAERLCAYTNATRGNTAITVTVGAPESAP